MDKYEIIDLLAKVVSIIFVFAPHEFAHAFIAYKNGDPTAKMRGRLTLNPFKHIDIYGFVACALVGFGWAKPVPINPNNFHKYKKGMFTTAVAGVIVNYIFAFFAYLILMLLVRFVFIENIVYLMQNEAVYCIYRFFESLFDWIFILSLCSVVFNLLPLAPLDGFRVVEAFTREINPIQRFLREYGNVILIILLAESFICSVLERYVAWAQYADILGYFMKFATQIIGFPIRKAWEWILYL